MLNRFRITHSICMLALVLAASARVANAQANIYVGYADDLRGSNFPSPWYGSPGVQYFFGTNAPGADAGAIMIQNNTASPFTIDAFSVHIGPYDFGLWTVPVTLNAGMSAIFTDPSHYSFDTSDLVAGPCYAPNTSVVPRVDVSINGTPNSYNDTGLILTTGGVDFAGCVGNEALGWRLIGTTGVDQPGNQVAPEPATLGLFGTGLLGLVGFLRRRRND